MRVLVTGAAGFIGRRACHRLAEHGHAVLRVVRSETRAGPANAEATSAQHTFAIDLLEAGALERALVGWPRPDVIVHMAAVLPPTFTGPAAERAADLNAQLDLNVFRAAQTRGLAVVYASSSSVYGLGDGDLKTETASPAPVGPYAAAKLASEHLGQRMLQERGVPFTVLRINAPYGPGQRTRTVLRIFLERAMQGFPLLYHGTGCREQDFTHVDDVADAVACAALRQRSGVYNISGGEPITMKRLAELVTRCVPSCTSTIAPSGQDDPQDGAAARYSIARALADLEWRPRIPLAYGIRAWAKDLLAVGYEDRSPV